MATKQSATDFTVAPTVNGVAIGGGGVSLEDVRAGFYYQGDADSHSTTAPKQNTILTYAVEADAITNAKYVPRPWVFDATIPASVGANNTATTANFTVYAKVKTADGTVVNANPTTGDWVIIHNNSGNANKFSGVTVNTQNMSYYLDVGAFTATTSWWLQTSSGGIRDLPLMARGASALVDMTNPRVIQSSEIPTAPGTTGLPALTSSAIFSMIQSWAGYVSGTTYELISGKRLRPGQTATTVNASNVSIATNTNVSNDYWIALSSAATAARTVTISAATQGLGFAPSDRMYFAFSNLNATYAMNLTWDASWKVPSGKTLPASIGAGQTAFVEFYYISAAQGWTCSNIFGV